MASQESKKSRPKSSKPKSRLMSEPTKSSGANCCTRLVFFCLFSTFTLLVLVTNSDYRQGDLSKAYTEHVPEHVRQHLETAKAKSAEVMAPIKAHFWHGYEMGFNFSRDHLNDLSIGGVNINEFIFGDLASDDEETETLRKQAEAVASMKEKVRDMDAKAKEQKRVEAEKKAREEAEKKAKEEADKRAREEAYRKAKEEAERKAREETERWAREEAEKKAQEEAEKKAQEEAERKAKEEAEKKAKEEAERKAKEEADKRAREEAEKKAKEEADKRAREEAEKKAKEEADKRAREEAEKEAKEEAKRKAQEKAEKKAKEEAERKTKEEAEKKAKEEAERKTKEEAEKKAKEEAERKAKEEAEKKAKEEMERKAREEAEKKVKEEAERKAKEEADKRARAEAEKKAKEEADKNAKEEADKRARAEAKRKAQEEAERKAREEADRKASQETEKKAKEEAEKKAREEATRRAKQDEEKAKAEAEKRAEEERVQKAKQEAEKKAQEEALKKAKQETEKKAKEEAEKKSRQEAEKKAKEEAELKAKRDAEHRAREEAERKAKQDAEKRAKEEAEKKAKEASEKKAKAERQAPKAAVENKAKSKKNEAREESERIEAAKKAAKMAQELNDKKTPDYAKVLAEASAEVSTDPHKSISLIDVLLTDDKFPPRATIKALCIKSTALYNLGQQLQSNSYLERSIRVCEDAIQNHVEVWSNQNKSDIVECGLECSRRMKFRGWSVKAARILEYIIGNANFDGIDLDKKALQRALGLQYLLSGKNEASAKTFESLLKMYPNDNFAKAHLGFILKTSDQNLARGVQLLQDAVNSNEEGTQDARFYLQLADGLRRLKRRSESDEIYRRGVDKGFFLSFYQRSLYNCPGLKARPVWTKEQTGLKKELEMLEANWKIIRDEALALIGDKGFVAESEKLSDQGDWHQLDLYVQGHKLPGCKKAPWTCAIIDQIPSASTNKRGQVKFSLMSPGTHVHAHSGPTNCRLRVHLGLKVPENKDNLKMRVAEQYLTWTEGEIFIFDDSFDHEVWHEAQGERLVLIVDIWHPELSQEERKTISPL